MKHIYVWARMPDGNQELVGELGTTTPDRQGAFESEFQYARRWLALRGAFDLAPGSVERSSPNARWRALNFEAPLGVFEDALPDSWGRVLLRREIGAGADTSLPAMLLTLKGRGTGCLEFTSQEIEPPQPQTRPSTAIAELMDAAVAHERGELEDEHLFRKLIEGGTPGGARPKALVHTEDGTEWIAKFPSRNDPPYEVVKLEAACLQLADLAGIGPPRSRLIRIGDRDALLVERFDTTAGRGRRHMLSMKTLCKAGRGVEANSYQELRDAILRYSAAPALDVARFFRQMVFNAAIGNIDDHTKNFAMVHQDNGWRLSPAFDLVPDTAGRREHTLRFLYDFHCPTRNTLAEIAAAWGVAGHESIVDEVMSAVGSVDACFDKAGITKGQARDRIVDDIRRRAELLQSSR